jgi:phosphoenolpyruvate-protein kinase (PTS system EI component)
MSPVSVPLIKQVMQKLHRNECAKFAETVLQLSTQQEVVDACHDFLVERDLINK